jgi:two-component system response regulator FixJ
MSGKKILVIDDEAGIRRSLEIHLRGAGYDVCAADTFARGLGLTLLGEFDLIICDLKLPDKSGIDIIRELKAQNANVPVVALSGFQDGHMIEQAKAAGAVEYLVKPCPRQMLLDTVRDVFSLEQTKGRNGR